MKMKEIVDSAGLVFPDDIIFLEPRFISKKIEKKSQIRKEDLSNTLYTLSNRAITSKRFYEIVPPGVEEPTVEMVKILVTARWANHIESVAPSLTTISKLSNLSRNVVSSCIRFLDVLDLIETRPYGRSQVVIPTRLTTLSINTILGNLKNENRHLKRVTNEMRKGEFSTKSLKFLEDLETAFHITKLAYDEATVNYEIMEDLHSRAMELVVKAKEGRNKEFIKSSAEFIKILEHIIATREKAGELGVKPAVLEDTGERLGRAKVFRVK